MKRKFGSSREYNEMLTKALRYILDKLKEFF